METTTDKKLNRLCNVVSHTNDEQNMIRIAFTLIGGKNWTGGHNYLLNLLRVLAEEKKKSVTPVLFFGTDVDKDEIKPFSQVSGVKLVCTPLINQSRRMRSLASSLILGCDMQIRELFHQQQIDIVFEAAQFFGSKLGLPAIAWMPDFQHRFMPHLFTRIGYWKRELGFRVQVASDRTIMLSSEDSRRICEQLYPATRGKIHTVRFSVPAPIIPTPDEARAVADLYGLPEEYIFMPNQFWKHKNHMLVVQGLSLLREQGHQIVVAASGKQIDPRNPGYFLELKAAIDSAGLTDSFRLLGFLPYEHLTPLACASIALLNPSHFEGWSTTIEEARSLGVPMLLSDLAVHREQASEKATYFDRYSPESLAGAIKSLKSHQDPINKLDSCPTPLESLNRVKRFADDFMSAVNDTIKS